MKEFWNERYHQTEFVYGKEPNVFFREQLEMLNPGRILLPAEGEGRNAVYAASRGWQVTAFDFSEEAMRKARLLASERKVSIDYFLAGYHSVSLPENHFNVLALIYAHAPDWPQVYQRLIKALKPGGMLIVEIFNKKQMENFSGGPKVLEMLVDAHELEAVLEPMGEVRVWEEVTDLQESAHHNGKADVTRCVAIK